MRDISFAHHAQELDTEGTKLFGLKTIGSSPFFFSESRAVVMAPFGIAPGGWILNDEGGELTGGFEDRYVGKFVSVKSQYERSCSIYLSILSSGSLEGS